MAPRHDPGVDVLALYEQVVIHLVWFPTRFISESYLGKKPPSDIGRFFLFRSAGGKSGGYLVQSPKPDETLDAARSITQ